MSAVAHTIAQRARYQAAERALLAELKIDLGDEPPCRECGCTDSLACPQGCGWAQPDLCSVCAAELDALADPVGHPLGDEPSHATNHREQTGATSTSSRGVDARGAATMPASTQTTTTRAAVVSPELGV
jgi:hypothetical protein